MFDMLRIYEQTVRWKQAFANCTSPKGRIALQVARQTDAPCDRTFTLQEKNKRRWATLAEFTQRKFL